MTEKLGIKIGGAVRIGIEPPAFTDLSPWYSFLLAVSFAVMLVAFTVLTVELFHLPFADGIYHLLKSWVSFNF